MYLHAISMLELFVDSDSDTVLPSVDVIHNGRVLSGTEVYRRRDAELGHDAKWGHGRNGEKA